MRRLAFTLACLLGPTALAAQDIDAILDRHILPGYDRLAVASEELGEVADKTCDPKDPALREAYQSAFDAWIGVSHLRFGPSETDNRAFALYFWPDPRSKTQKSLATLIRDADPVVDTPQQFATVSIASRGFLALERLLFDDGFQSIGDPDYRCRLIRAISRDIAANSAAIAGGWAEGYGDLMRHAGENDTYRSRDEALRQIFTALTTALEFTADTRLGRPMGTYDRPRPARAEARLSGRSLRNVILSLDAARALAAELSDADPTLDAHFADAIERASRLNDPVFAGVSDPQSRFRIEVLQQAIQQIRHEISEDLGPSLGIAAGFNSLDGD